MLNPQYGVKDYFYMRFVDDYLLHIAGNELLDLRNVLVS
jgi:hypothetical protein